MVRVFRLFQEERALKSQVKGIVVKQAQEYYPRADDPDYSAKDDAPWIRRFAADGGRAIVSSDRRMLTKPHEKLALVQSGLVVIFFSGAWYDWKFCAKSALILHWWPTIMEAVSSAEPGFYRVPIAWPAEGAAQLKQVPTHDLKMIKIDYQKSQGEAVRKARQKRRDGEALEDLFRDRAEGQQ